MRAPSDVKTTPSVGSARSSIAGLFRQGRPAAQAFSDVSARTTAPASQELSEPSAIVRWAFALFILVIPFDTVNFPSEDFALTKTVGILFLAIALIWGRESCFRRPPLAFWTLATYVVVFTALGITADTSYRADVLTRVGTWIQLLGLFWVSVNMMRSLRISRDVWMTFAAGCVVLSLLQITHIGGTTFDADPVAGAARSTAVGANANQLCGILALGAVALVGAVFGRVQCSPATRWLVVPCLAALAGGMLSTVSRGGLLALAAGLAVYLFSHGNRQAAVRTRLVVLVGLAAMLVATACSPYLRSRFEQAVLQGNFAKREYIYPAALEMFQQKPIIGWGPVAHRFELGRRTFWTYHHQEPDTHNLFLWVATESGLFGIAPYFMFIALCLYGALRAHRDFHETQPLAMMATLIVVNVGGTWIYYKLMYLVLAYAVARACRRQLVREPEQPRAFRIRGRNLPAVPLGARD